MMNIIEEFIKDMGEGEFYSNLRDDIIKKYQNKFLTDHDSDDIISSIWGNYGLRSYKDGLFWLINPDEFNDLARKFPDVSDDALVFARTGIGNLFLLEEGVSGKNIIYLNTHKGIKNIVGRSFNKFFNWNIVTDIFWETKCYGKIEIMANKRFGQMEATECYSFIPALALGGNEKIDNLQKVKIKENLEFLSQLY